MPAGVAVHLLGRPRIEVDGASGYRFRSRKSWALLAFLLLAERPPTRSRLASLLFAEADDPLRALRWCLAEVRRGPRARCRARRRPGAADAAARGDGRRRRAGPRPLERGARSSRGSGWTSSTGWPSPTRSRSRPGCCPSAGASSAAAESIVHEAALGLLARGELERARDLAVQATEMSPLDENHQALLIRIYRLAGDDEAAARQFDAWSATAERELGTSPGAAVLLAARERPASERAVTRCRSTRSPRAARPPSPPGPSGPGSRLRDGGADGRPVRCRQRAGPDPAGAGRGADPHARRPRRGRAGGPTEAERIAIAQGDRESVALPAPSSATSTSSGRATTAPSGCSTRCWRRRRRRRRPGRRR